jgi:hypothetical protein
VRFSKGQPKNVEELVRMAQEEWERPDREAANRTIGNMPRHVDRCSPMRFPPRWCCTHALHCVTHSPSGVGTTAAAPPTPSTSRDICVPENTSSPAGMTAVGLPCVCPSWHWLTHCSEVYWQLASTWNNLPGAYQIYSIVAKI